MQPPFVMDKWIVGIQQNQKVDYTVNYEVSHSSSCERHLTKQSKHAHQPFEIYVLKCIKCII